MADCTATLAGNELFFINILFGERASPYFGPYFDLQWTGLARQRLGYRRLCQPKLIAADGPAT